MKASSNLKRKCEKCEREFSSSYISKHRKSCLGEVQQDEAPLARVYRSERAPCEMCGEIQAKTNMSRHRKNCPGRMAFH